MKKNVVKIITILLIALMIVGISNIVMATAEQQVSKIADVIIGVIQVIGVAVAIIMLVMLGIKYVSAAPSEKADIKKSAAIYVVGAVLLFAATFILGFVKNLVTDFGGESGGKPTVDSVLGE